MKYESLKDGTTLLLREPTMEDVESSHRFFHALPAEDRRYLRIDVTKKDIVERRIRQGVNDEVYRILALVGDEIVADGALEFSGEGWRRHTAEIRVIVGAGYQRRGVGSVIIQDLFRTAQQREVEKVVVKMAEPQHAVRSLCERLGFEVEAVLKDYIKDAEGNVHSLVVMACNLGEMFELQEFYADKGFPDG